MEQLIDLSNVRHIGHRAHQAMHQTRFGIADVRFHSKKILISFLGLVHFRVASTVLIFGQTRRANDRRIDHRTLAQHQTAVTQIAVDHLQDPARQLIFRQHAPEVEDRGFIGNPIQMQPRELVQNRRFIQ
jgi:hypothetical protein